MKISITMHASTKVFPNLNLVESDSSSPWSNKLDGFDDNEKGGKGDKSERQ